MYGDETKTQRINFLMTGDDYLDAAEAIADLTDGTTPRITPAGPFRVRGIFLLRDRRTGDLAEYTRDDAYPDRRPDIWEVELSVAYDDGEPDSVTVCYKRTETQAKKEAARLNRQDMIATA